MKAAEYCKALGLPSLKIASEISGVSSQTLNNWLSNKPFIFHAVIEKAAKEYKAMNHVEQVENISEPLQEKAISLIKDETGYEAGMVVYKFFAEKTNHPHAKYTFDQMAMERDMSEDNTVSFAKSVAEKLAWRVAENEVLASGS